MEKSHTRPHHLPCIKVQQVQMGCRIINKGEAAYMLVAKSEQQCCKDAVQ